MLQLIVECCKAEREFTTMLGQFDATTLWHVVVEGVVETWRHQLVVQEEVCDAELQQRTCLGNEFVAVNGVIAIKGAEKYLATRQ